MNSKDFIQVLRKVIQEEVRTAVREELSIIGKSINESRNIKPISTTVKQNVYGKKPINKSNSASKKQFANNPLLNDLLNETAGFSNEGPKVFLEESIGVNHIDYNDFSEWPTMNSRKPSPKAAPIPTVDAEGRPVDVKKLAETEAGAAVVNALTRDYSSLMKAINKKKGN